MAPLRYDVISDVADLPDGILEQLAPQYRTVASPALSLILERSLDARVIYLIVRDSGGAPLALVYLVEATAAFPFGSARLRSTIPMKIAVCGHPIISADCGIVAHTRDSRDRLLPELLPLVSRFLRKRGAVAVMMKDTAAPRPILEAAGFWRLPLEPVMGIPAVNQWAKFDDYLAAMRPDHRRKIRSARAKVENTGMKLTVERDCGGLVERLHGLYVTVATRPRPPADYPDQETLASSTGPKTSAVKRRWADFLEALPTLLTDLPRRLRLRELNPTFFSLFPEGFRAEVDIISLRDQTNGDVRAYTMNIQDGPVYHSLFIGMDYTGDTRFIYRALLSAKIERAIERGVRDIEFGRTSLLTKAELGAQPQPVSCYVRFLHPMLVPLNPLAKSLLSRVPDRRPPVRRVFRSDTGKRTD